MGQWGVNLCDLKFYNLYSSSSIIRMVKLRLGWVGQNDSDRKGNV
jgi:hypothetical protein